MMVAPQHGAFQKPPNRRVGSVWLLFFASAGLGFATYALEYALGRSRVDEGVLKIGLAAGAIGILCLVGFLRPFIGRALAWGLFLAGTGGTGFFVYSQYSEMKPTEAEEQAGANRDYIFFRLYRVCYGGTVPDAAELAEGGPHTAAFFSTGKEWSASGWRWDEVEQWIPSTIEEAELVLCEWRTENVDNSTKGEGTLTIHQALTGQVVAQYPLPAAGHAESREQIIELAREIIEDMGDAE